MLVKQLRSRSVPLKACVCAKTPRCCCTLFLIPQLPAKGQHGTFDFQSYCCSRLLLLLLLSLSFPSFCRRLNDELLAAAQHIRISLCAPPVAPWRKETPGCGQKSNGRGRKEGHNVSFRVRCDKNTTHPERNHENGVSAPIKL